MSEHGRERKPKTHNGAIDLQARAAEALVRYAANGWQGPDDSLRYISSRVATRAWESEPDRRKTS